ncbi:MAG: formate dehydrogenase accessory sulfurtransferase FdhD [Solirubrobacteraceae bacterium]|nr:formate dehydrogenase accessory sulfurtransferase FdhD [Solirubrobacteraceae bacterium]
MTHVASSTTRTRVARTPAVVVDASGARQRTRERVAGEEPLEIRIALGGGVLTTTSTMRTPGSDFALAAGLLHAEGVIATRDDIERIRYCADVRTGPFDSPSGASHTGASSSCDARDQPSTGPSSTSASASASVEHGPGASATGADASTEPRTGRRATGPNPDQQFNVVTVDLARRPRHPLGQRTLMATASCGVCGSAEIDELCERIAPIDSDLELDAGVLTTLPDFLQVAQRVFAETGGLHAAGLFDAGGRLLALHEDIGRHNALDKLIGEQLLAGALPARERVIVLSGRISFELVQKAAAAGAPVLAAVGAPSNLAVATAERLGLTLAGWVRDGRATLYTHPDRIVQPGRITPRATHATAGADSSVSNGRAVDGSGQATGSPGHPFGADPAAGPASSPFAASADTRTTADARTTRASTTADARTTRASTTTDARPAAATRSSR